MKSKSCPSRRWPALACLLLLPTTGLAAGGFAAGISPSKFELKAKPGQVLRDTVTILNPAAQTAEFQVRTADWRLSAGGGVEFLEDQLPEDSCRPWVRLERKTVQIRAQGQKKYRFEVHVPEGAAPGLCRFAIFIEPSEAEVARMADGRISLPVVGRYAVITYVAIGDAAAQVTYLGATAVFDRDRRLPALKLKNTGNNYDRAFGQIMATDSRGERFALIPSSFPLLPGRTDAIRLTPESRDSGPGTAELAYPLTLKGRIEIGGETIRVDEVLR
jgi:P pilus assembly chaperone PapD